MYGQIGRSGVPSPGYSCEFSTIKAQASIELSFDSADEINDIWHLLVELTLINDYPLPQNP